MTKEKNLKLFLYTQILSIFAYNLFVTSINFHVLDLTGSATKFSGTVLLGILPKLLFLQVAGLVTDFFDKKRSFVLSDVAYATIVFVLIIISYFTNFTFYTLAVISFITGIIRSFSIPINKTIIPLIVDKKAFVKANSYEVSNDKIARTLAPVLALYLSAFAGFRVAIVLTFVLYVLTAFLKSKIEIGHVISKADSSTFIDKLKSNLNRVREGFNITIQNRNILFVLINAVITQIFFHQFMYIVYPIFLKSLDYSEMGTIVKISSLLSMGKSAIWKSVNAWINLGSVIGVISSMAYIRRIKDSLDEKRGISLGIYGISFVGILLSLSFIGFKTFGWKGITFVNILFLLNGMLYFFFNIFTIFFSSYYQKIIGKDMLGRFVANFMVMFSVSSLIGISVYGRLSSYGWKLPIAFLMFGSCLKIFLQFFFFSQDKDENIGEEK